MILSIIIPVYNEENTILESLKRVKNLNSKLFEHEIIVINDGSTDNTNKILSENKSLYDKLLTNEINKGKGYSIKKGLIQSKLAQAPFIKVEATRFTEVGYVGRDVEQIIRDLIEIAIAMEKEKKRKEVHAKAQQSAEEKVLDALVGKKASLATRESFRKRLRSGDLDTNEIEIEVNDTKSGMPSFEIPGMPGANIGMVNIGEMLGKSMGPKGKHSDETDNVYVSKEFSTLKTSIPDFIKNNSELNSKIKNIKYAPQNEGGEGALIIKLKKITK